MADLPLSGIRVLDFTWAWAGPFCTMQLAHLGAEVIRLETVARPPCVTRLIPPFADDVPGPNRAGYFNQYNQGKKSVSMNLARPEAVELIGEMLKHCDIVADNFAAGVMEKLGLGYERLRRFKPDLIMISMSGYGQTGPYKGFVGYGPPASAASGMFFGTGYEGGDPGEIGVSYPDPNAGVFGAFALIAALTHRALTGEGQFIDQSQLETALVMMPEGLLEYEINQREPVRAGNHDRLMSPNECYRAAGDDQWVSIAVGNEAEWQALCGAMGKPNLAQDPRFATPALRKQNEAALDRHHHRMDQRARPLGNHQNVASRRRRRVPRDEQQGPGGGPAPESARLPGSHGSPGNRRTNPCRNPMEDVRRRRAACARPLPCEAPIPRKFSKLCSAIHTTKSSNSAKPGCWFRDKPDGNYGLLR